MRDLFLPTGNEMVSIPKLSQESAGIEDVTFLHMGYKGLIELRGGSSEALIAPFVEVDDASAPLRDLHWERLEFWVPRFSARAGSILIGGTILTPIGERGFAYRLRIENTDNVPRNIKWGLRGRWASAWHRVNEDKEIEGAKHCFTSGWNNSLIFDLRCGVPMFCFAPMPERSDCVSVFHQDEQEITYSLSHTDILEPGDVRETVIYWGLGFEEVAAATSAKEMLRQGYRYEEEKTLSWLRARSWTPEDEALSRFYNTNLFFCLFFSTGLTLDTEELVLVTSRSPRYYVSAAYWDRDSFLWSFPAVLDVDTFLAREMLEYAFGRQRRNIGVHSRFIDGTVLEPGFELDELMAPVLALGSYLEKTGDRTILDEPAVQKGLRDILRKLETRKHPQVDLYSTFLQPTDDEHVYPYLTYDNVLVWKGLRILAKLLHDDALAAKAGCVRKAIMTHCVIPGGNPYFAWSVDLNGQHDVYDEPPGSLQLLPYWGFCDPEDEVYQNTANMIRSAEYQFSFAGYPFGEIGCPHAPHPWLLSVANSLLCGRVEHSIDILKNAPMDNGIACESIDENGGFCQTGEAFATCAGFICHALRTAWEGCQNEK